MKKYNPKNIPSLLQNMSKSDIKWFLEKVCVPIAVIIIPLAPSAIAPSHKEQPPQTIQTIGFDLVTKPPQLD